MRFEILSQRVMDSFHSFSTDWGKRSDEAKQEVRDYRNKVLGGKQLWGQRAEASFGLNGGEVLTGDVPTEMVVTPLLNKLSGEIDLVNERFDAIWGYGSVFNVGYIMHDMYGPYVEWMNPHAFDPSLQLEVLQMSFLRSHEGLGLATTQHGRMRVGVDVHGLGFAASLNQAESDASELMEKLRNGSTSSQTSIGGYIEDYQWNDEYTEVEIMEWNLSRGEISVVHAGANPAGWVSMVEYATNPVIDLNALAEIQQEREKTTVDKL